jgi:hypothetical protein
MIAEFAARHRLPAIYVHSFLPARVAPQAWARLGDSMRARTILARPPLINTNATLRLTSPRNFLRTVPTACVPRTSRPRAHAADAGLRLSPDRSFDRRSRELDARSLGGRRPDITPDTVAAMMRR